MAWIGALIAAGGSLISSGMASSSQAGANKTNVKLQREQQAWEERMSNTAIQRRADDIERAGFNRLLAATGPGASTPTVAPARVEPKYKGEAGQAFASAMLLRAQLDQMKAQTQNVSAQTEQTHTQTEIMKEITGPTSAAELEAKIKKNQLFNYELKKAIADADISETTAQLLKDKSASIIRLLKAQAGTEELDYESAQALVKSLGVVGKDAGQVAKIILSAFKALFLRK